jgi:hypothetical protein
MIPSFISALRPNPCHAVILHLFQQRTQGTIGSRALPGVIDYSPKRKMKKGCGCISLIGFVILAFTLGPWAAIGWAIVAAIAFAIIAAMVD